MERIDPQQIAQALLLDSAGWARCALTAPSATLREQAARELAATICARIDPPVPADYRQLGLPFEITG